ncbi:anti-sigma factor [Bacillus weihaiensis]|uniref:Sigma factor regulator C-terminal domain-containing protein n=1 Tax=Bacillus weihaiensis TaxID=1547283 RepID=A0A1L3MVR3_9BACI|nr:anti-sigma factor [Bacillus weihaiensis]APH06431.1 hypothetical protein A9C19_17775 [Bacillus weihaiensis]
MEWNENKEKKIFRKYRFTLTVRIIRIIITCLILFWIYMMVVYISFHSLKSDMKHSYFSSLANDWTIPNLYEELGGNPNSRITPFLTQIVNEPVYKKVGKDYQAVGTITIEKTLFTHLSSREIHYFDQQAEEGYVFFLPEDPRNGESLSTDQDDHVWYTLDKIHEGTVGELSFSTEKFMTPEELLELLKPYDLELIWAPLYTGEFKEYKPTSYSESENSLQIDNWIGLAGGRKSQEDYTYSAKINILNEETLKESQNMMLTNMNQLLEEESTSYYETFLGLSHLDNRYEYIKQNGFIVYGGVVTGPVKELLKLKEVEEIRGAKLGELSYWNWDEQRE